MWANSHSVGLLNLVAGKAIRVPLWFCVSAAVARLLGPDGLGKWSMILAAGMLLNQFFLHWTQAITQRFARQELVMIGRIEPMLMLRVPLLMGGLLFALVLLYLIPASWVDVFFGIEKGPEIVLALLAFWFMAETQSIQQVRERFGPLAWSPIAVDLLLLLVILGISWGIPATSRLTIWGMLAALLLTMLVGWLVLLINELRATRWNGVQTDFTRLPTTVLFAVPLVPGFLVAYFAEWCDYFLIRHFFHDYEVGLFHSAYQYLLILVGVPTALVSVLLPSLVTLYDKHGGELLIRFVDCQAPRFALAWGVLILVPLALLPWIFELLFGAAFELSARILTVLLAAVPGAVVQHVYGIAYFLRGRLVFSTLLFFLVKLVVNFTFSWTLLPLVGLEASAYSVVISYFVLQWLFLSLAVAGRRASKNGVIVLIWCQVCGLALCGVEALFARLVLAIVLLGISLRCLRYANLFDAGEVSRALPVRFKRYESLLLRWLCGLRECASV